MTGENRHYQSQSGAAVVLQTIVPLVLLRLGSY